FWTVLLATCDAFPSRGSHVHRGCAGGIIVCRWPVSGTVIFCPSADDESAVGIPLSTSAKYGLDCFTSSRSLSNSPRRVSASSSADSRTAISASGRALFRPSSRSVLLQHELQ
ncbi:unnamed protein product, partial [Ectocarpus sp. 12 AP-2014]